MIGVVKSFPILENGNEFGTWSTVYRVNIAAVKLMRTLRTHGVRIY